MITKIIICITFFKNMDRMLVVYIIQIENSTGVKKQDL